MSMIDTTTQRTLGRFLDASVARYRQINQNLANIDTPGYRTRDVDLGPGRFHAELSLAAEFADFAIDLSPTARLVRGLPQRPDGNNVSVERETLLLAETQLKFRLGVALLKDEFHGIAMAITSGGTSS